MSDRRGWIGVVALGILAGAGCTSRPLDPMDPVDPRDPVDQPPHPVMDAGTDRPAARDAADARDAGDAGDAGDARDAMDAGSDRPATPSRDAGAVSDALMDPCPVTQPPAGTFTFLSAGSGGTCGLRTDGTMACWGVSWEYPEPNPDGTTYRHISRHLRVCAVRSSGEIECWGLPPGVPAAPAGTFEQVVVGEGALCVRSGAGQASCAGGAGYAPPDYRFRSLTGGAYYACGLEAAQGAAVCWEPRVGADSVVVRPGPFSAVDTGRFFGCGLRLDGSVDCWATSRSTPTAAILLQSAPEGPFSQISTGEFHACALRADGEVVCWGENRDGQATPPAGLRLTRVEGGSTHSCGIQPDATVVCWGSGGWICTPAGRG
jgi:hypothetical protein